MLGDVSSSFSSALAIDCGKPGKLREAGEEKQEQHAKKEQNFCFLIPLKHMNKSFSMTAKQKNAALLHYVEDPMGEGNSAS